MSESSSLGGKVDRYFDLHARIEDAIRSDDYRTVASCVKNSIPLFQALVEETKRDYGRFDIQRSVAVDKGGRVLAAMGDIVGLKEMHRRLERIPELQDWRIFVEGLLEDVEIGEKIIAVVKQTPGIRQFDMKGTVGTADGRRIATICLWLEKVGRLRRERQGRSFTLSPR